MTVNDKVLTAIYIVLLILKVEGYITYSWVTSIIVPFLCTYMFNLLVGALYRRFKGGNNDGQK